MGLLEKIKNALFEEDDDDDEKVSKKETRTREDKIAKKIDVTKTTAVDVVQRKEEALEPLDFKTPERPKGPIIFDDDDFLSDTKESHFKEVPKKEEKILYGGYETKKEEIKKEKFRPSPIISPVYGLLDQQKKEEKIERKTLDHIFVEERKKEINIDSIREKAFGDIKVKKEEPIIEEEKSLLYDMQEDNDMPSIGKITLGDAEEYFEDLGLEYEVDYKDEAKQNMTRSLKNKELPEIVEEEIKEEVEEQPKKTRTIRTTKKELIPKEEKEVEEEYQEPEEKNLYDLIDMMYESKE